MDDLISRQAAIETVGINTWAGQRLSKLPSAQHNIVEVVRCKDCKHRPSGTVEEDDLEFPDDRCPCQCEDYWYSWKPDNNWFCGNGERSEDETN